MYVYVYIYIYVYNVYICVYIRECICMCIYVRKYYISVCELYDRYKYCMYIVNISNNITTNMSIYNI